MPATEQTCYSMKILHTVFGVSALVLAFATFWLLAKDHNREWKAWQLADRKKEAWMLAARREAKTDEYASRMEQFERDLREVRSGPIDKKQIEKFEAEVKSEYLRLSGLGLADKQIGFDELHQSHEACQRASLDIEEVEQTVASQTEAEGGVPEDRHASEDQETDEEVPIDGAHEPLGDLNVARNNALAARLKLFDAMGMFLSEAKRREKLLVRQKRFVHADRTASVSELGLLVGGGALQDEQEKVQAHIGQLDDRLALLTQRIANAKDHHGKLEAISTEIDAEGRTLVKNLDAMRAELHRLHEQIYLETSNLGEWITRLPILDALYNGNIKIDQIWLPDLTINYNFTQAARFDRCKSCHRAISQTAAGTPTDPAYPTIPPSRRAIVLSLDRPDEQPGDGEPDGRAGLKKSFGFVLADEGIFDSKDVTVLYVVPESSAARAGLKSGDVLLRVGDAPSALSGLKIGVRDARSPCPVNGSDVSHPDAKSCQSTRVVDEPDQVADRFLKDADWGEPVSLTIRRGLAHPFTSHPRLDLFLTDLSPHPEKIFGCTICHDGQGSGTAFQWTSHTPDNGEQQQKWNRDYDWFDNHHWIFPMKPRRFLESNCLKCHYNKAELEASERFPKPPAPKLVEGWTLVEQMGCFGCHETNGWDGPNRRVGPDLRLEPNTHEMAAQMLRDGGLNEDERDWATRLVQSPGNARIRERLMASVGRAASLAAESPSEGRLNSNTVQLARALKNVEVPGKYRKVGPSLRHLNAKVDFDWLVSWIHGPSDFRPTTRMPQFFHQWEHLEGAEDARQKGVSEKFEPMEVRALTEFLLAGSSEFEYLKPPEEVTESPSADRGKWLFESRGCLACHAHEKFPRIESTQGPDLSRIGAKFNTEKGRAWIYSWLQKPHRYHPRTKMPQLYLDPMWEIDAQGHRTGKVTDPAADTIAFLLGLPTDWRPIGVPSRRMTPREEQVLADLALEWLASDTIPSEKAEDYLRDGIPETLSARLKENERFLIGINDENRVSRQMEFVARRTVGKYGCFGCHDIPGFEDAKPIGTSHADWGRKESSKLAFENIHKFLEIHGVEAPGSTHPDQSNAEQGKARDMVGHGHFDPLDFDAEDSYFVQALNSHSRDGFLWQKLRMPRSYDYKTTRNKGYNERLRMPRFTLNDEEREAIMTFVLGLVREPPAEQFAYHPDPRQEAMVRGKQVLDKFHCAGCHAMRMEQWQLEFDEDTFESSPEVVDYPFLDKQFGEKEIAASQRKDRRGLLHATLHGLTVRSEETGEAVRFDDDGMPLEEEDDESDPYYLFTLWRDALIHGERWPVGVRDLLIPARPDGYGPAQGTSYPAWGGDLASYLFPRVIAHARQANPRVKGAEAWGWLPSPLMAVGTKVRLEWLHGFLMDPFAIRPAAVMRMPNFHMSGEDATRLVNYFAASAGAEFPYEFRPEQRPGYRAIQEAHAPDRMREAMRVVTNGNYCVKCHSVADFSPQGERTMLGPDLAGVQSRLRPDYVRKWIANPRRVLPYTGMPVNLPYDPDMPHLGGVSQDLIRGTSIQQLDGLVDLLMNFNRYLQRQTSVQSLVQPDLGESKMAPSVLK
jgi:cbb3-type cytochrome oxidase cytochrome c subunit